MWLESEFGYLGILIKDSTIPEMLTSSHPGTQIRKKLLFYGFSCEELPFRTLVDDLPFFPSLENFEESFYSPIFHSM